MNKRQERKRISARRWLLERYYRDNRCHYCGTATYLFDGPLRATVDHKVPRSSRRWNHWTNYALACSTCNQEKGSLDYDTYRRWKAAQGIETRRAETGTGSVHESPMAKPCAQGEP